MCKLGNKKENRQKNEYSVAICGPSKTYDSIPLKQLWKSLEEDHINKNLSRAAQQLYNKTLAKIKIVEKFSESRRKAKDLKQACCRSPTLFSLL